MSEEGVCNLFGAQREEHLEPKFEALWERFQDPNNAENVKEILSMIDASNPTISINFPIVDDMAQFSGT